MPIIINPPTPPSTVDLCVFSREGQVHNGLGGLGGVHRLARGRFVNRPLFLGRHGETVEIRAPKRSQKIGAARKLLTLSDDFDVFGPARKMSKKCLTNFDVF